MPNGDPGQIPEMTEEVLSQQEVHEQEPETPKESKDPSGKTPEERFRNSQFAQNRIHSKKIRQQLTQLEDDPREIMEMTAKNLGFDLSKEGNKEHIDFQAAYEKNRTEVLKKKRNEVASAVISETLLNLGLDPASRKGRAVGSALMEKHGNLNPTVYEDEGLVQKIITEVTEEFVGKKDPVNESIIRKASSNLPQKQNPKGLNAPGEDKQLTEEAARMGISKDKVKIFQEKRNKIPKYWA